MDISKFLKSFFLLFILFGFAQTDYNKTDEQGKKHGAWRGFYPETKNLKYEGVFDHGKEIGRFTFYDDSKAKNILATRDFDAKSNAAYTVLYDRNKKKISEGNVVNKQYEGSWKYYHKGTDQLMSIESYNRGKLDGMRKVYYPSGKLAEEEFYILGMKQGNYKKYAENGIAIEETNYNNNEFDGPAIFRDAESGTPISQGKFLRGKKVGIWQFFEKGKLINEVNMSFKPKGKLPKTSK